MTLATVGLVLGLVAALGASRLLTGLLYGVTPIDPLAYTGVVVVLGAEIEQSRAALADRPIQIVINSAWAEGQSSSLKAGLAALPANVTSAVFLLVDLPAVTPPIVNALIERHQQTLAPLVWPEYQGRRGNPVLFDRALFAELFQIQGDTGGKPVLAAHRDQAERVAVDDPAVVQDIDRPEDLAALET